MGKLAAEAAPTSSTGSRVRIFRRHPRGGGTGAQRAERPQAARRASEASHPVVPAAADGESSRLKPLLQDQGLAASVAPAWRPRWLPRSEEHTSELQSLMRISYAVFCLKKPNN